MKTSINPIRIAIAPAFKFLIEVSYNMLKLLSGVVAHIYVKLWSSLNIPWFDHRFDWLRGPTNWMWNERGILGNRFIKPGDHVLDLCCGDGIYSGLFYSNKAGVVHGIDRNNKGIKHANRHYKTDNIEFYNVDVIQENFPLEKYNKVFMFGSIEHFTFEDGMNILKKIARAISDDPEGLFLGSTPLFHEATGQCHPEHVNEFTKEENLRIFLSAYFAEIEFWESNWGRGGARSEIYFVCRKPVNFD